MRVLIALMFSLLCSQGFASEVIRLEGISIQGNSEEPNVMYITPWQAAPGTGRMFAPVKSFRDQWFVPVSRNSFRRETSYLNHFQQGSLSDADDNKSQ